jgi:hypothetical protein
MSGMLRKGLILENISSRSRGVLIDWGISARFKTYLPCRREAADTVRVWTRGMIELWPMSAIAVQERWIK